MWILCLLAFLLKYRKLTLNQHLCAKLFDIVYNIAVLFLVRRCLLIVSNNIRSKSISGCKENHINALLHVIVSPHFSEGVSSFSNIKRFLYLRGLQTFFFLWGPHHFPFFNGGQIGLYQTFTWAGITTSIIVEIHHYFVCSHLALLAIILVSVAVLILFFEHGHCFKQTAISLHWTKIITRPRLVKYPAFWISFSLYQPFGHYLVSLNFLTGSSVTCPSFAMVHYIECSVGRWT